MTRGAGWHFLDIGRRIERAIDTCRLARHFAADDATLDDLDVLLDLIDSQITYRSRYLVGLSLMPVRDMVVLDADNPRSIAFQVPPSSTISCVCRAARRRHPRSASPPRPRPQRAFATDEARDLDPAAILAPSRA